MCVEQEIQMQIKDILHKNKINHNFQQKELNKFTSFCELCIIYPTGITSLADCKAEFSHKWRSAMPRPLAKLSFAVKIILILF